ncbi:unnamed protein product [Rhizoctonia solani]|uniref:Uncharacterized protein n=1 Tax=Rhizoctonia solani TaxID=456999 RepID=A0A8H3DUJ0_9AGAM|nr:unnamed protein product [Rhizoctonia solani]
MIDNKPIKETGKLTLVIYPTCRLKLDDQVNCGVVNGLSQGHVKLHGRDPDNRAPHVNRQLTVVLCILCIFTLAIHTVSILFRLSISGDTKSSRGNTQLRGRRNDVIAAPMPTRDHPKSLDTAPRSSSCDGVRGRGRKPSVEEITSPTLLNPTQGEWFKHYPVDVGVLANFEYDQVKAKTASAAVEVADDAYIHPSCNCISHESRWSTSEIDTTIAHPEVIVLPVGGQGSQRGSSSSIHQSSPPVVGSLKPVLLRPSYHSFPYFFQRFSSVVLAEYFWPSAGFSSYGRKSRAPNRNRILRLLSGRRPTLFLMVIAVDEAVRDLWVLDRALTVLNSESVHFMGLGGWVTLEDIKTGVKRLCEESKEFPDSQIVILLTGHRS